MFYISYFSLHLKVQTEFYRKDNIKEDEELPKPESLQSINLEQKIELDKDPINKQEICETDSQLQKNAKGREY